MSSRMSRPRYRALCKYAGEWLEEPLPRGFALDDVSDLRVRTGVYIVCEPLERVQYVGSVRRPASPFGVTDRLKEHTREGYKRLLWTKVWIIPMKDETPLKVVRSVEGMVGADLLPLAAGRLPRFV